jgi:capsular polysaccharide biosynthesis protein
VNRRHLPSILSGILLAALIMGAGAFYALKQPVKYTAKASVVVLPAQGLDPSTAAGYYETLSRGQIVATLAEVLRLQRFEQSAALRLKLTPAQRAQTKVTVEVVPTTAMVNISVRGSTAATSEALADVILADAVPYLSQLSAPYTVSVVGSAANSAVRSGPSSTVLLEAAALIALISGLAAQQGIYHLSVAAWRRRASAPPENARPPTGPPSRPPTVDRDVIPQFGGVADTRDATSPSGLPVAGRSVGRREEIASPGAARAR